MNLLSVNFLFYFFSGILVISSIMVVVSRHSVFSLLFLVSSFLCSLFLLFLLECEFLGLILIVIYVGAIAVLFLFAVMMLDVKLQDLSKNSFRYFPIWILFGFSFLTPLIMVIYNKFIFNTIIVDDNIYINWYDLINATNDIDVYGQVLYSYFVLQFLIVGLILLVVLIGVVYLTNIYNSKQTIDVSTFKQLSTNSKFFRSFDQ